MEELAVMDVSMGFIVHYDGKDDKIYMLGRTKCYEWKQSKVRRKEGLIFPRWVRRDEAMK